MQEMLTADQTSTSIELRKGCEMTTLPLQKLYIDGVLCEATSGEVFDTFNPAAGERICGVQVASQADVDRAVASAANGQKVWAAMMPEERGRILMRAAAILRERNRELAELGSVDNQRVAMIVAQRYQFAA